MECANILLSNRRHSEHHCNTGWDGQTQGNGEADTLYFDFESESCGKVRDVSEEYLDQECIANGEWGGRNQNRIRIGCLRGVRQRVPIVDLECGNGFLNIYLDYLNLRWGEYHPLGVHIVLTLYVLTV